MIGDKRTRPATDRMREAVFSFLGARVQGAGFVDLFAGSGSYGLEALSRGALGGVFVENNHRNVLSLKKNLTAVSKNVEGGKECRIAVCNALSWKPFGLCADIIFVDPPYDLWDKCGEAVLKQADHCLKKDRGALLVAEMPAGFNLGSNAWLLVRRLGRGNAQAPTVAVYQRAL